MSAQIVIHPQMLRRAPFAHVIHYFETLGYSLARSPARNIEVRPIEPATTTQSPFRSTGSHYQ